MTDSKTRTSSAAIPAPDNHNGTDHDSPDVGREPARPRTCGDCRLCCTILAVHELGKRPYVPCAFECAAGCAQYVERPQSCRSFVCAWLAGHGDEDARPDRCGVVVAVEHVWKTPTVYAFERRGDATTARGDVTKGAAARLLRKFVANGVRVVPVRGPREDAS
jgi:hypothetical protein